MKNKFKYIIAILIIIVFVTILIIFNSSKNTTNNIKIMLDPGHGGEIPNLKGAIISTGGREVTLNNRLTLIIEELLIEEGYTVVFTNDPNDEDDYISLTDRSKIANIDEPDLFISIHHDSIWDESVKGYSIYYSSYRPNIDNEGVYVIYKNIKYKYIKEEIFNDRTHIYYEDDGVQKELISGVDNYYVRDKTPDEVVLKSKEFAELLYDELIKLEYMKPLRDTKDKTIMDNDLRITRTTNMPSILIEAGFVSNKDEAIQISNEENQYAFAKKMVKAINNYFNK
ncbi:MAG: N-acetylmuramoyl-L-alanine amidase family protein [Eubacteriaceae bacterium]